MLPEQTRLASTSANREQVAIPRPIHQAETKQLTQAIPPDMEYLTRNIYKQMTSLAL
ncbi:MAG: hypothetical protein K2X94_02185 [Amoebophilaceae bacterium]|nr:hypothetical protein [Amoebophilaceae bacterium]